MRAKNQKRVSFAGKPYDMMINVNILIQMETKSSNQTNVIFVESLMMMLISIYLLETKVQVK